MSEEHINNVLEAAVLLVLSRSGDIDTEDGNFACVGTDEVIRLDEAIAIAFNLDSDDVNESDKPIIEFSLRERLKLQKEVK